MPFCLRRFASKPAVVGVVAHVHRARVSAFWSTGAIQIAQEYIYIYIYIWKAFLFR